MNRWLSGYTNRREKGVVRGGGGGGAAVSLAGLSSWVRGGVDHSVTRAEDTARTISIGDPGFVTPHLISHLDLGDRIAV